MAAVAGSIEAVTLDGRNFAVAADADANRFMGGFTNEQEANGDGTARMVKTRKPWKISGVSLEVDDSNEDDTFLQDLMDRTANYPISITLASGKTYQGTGQITGDAETGLQSQTKPLDMSGPGRLTPQ
jgi:hypothetical protein